MTEFAPGELVRVTVGWPGVYGRLTIVVARLSDDYTCPHMGPSYATRDLATGEDGVWYAAELEKPND